MRSKDMFRPVLILLLIVFLGTGTGLAQISDPAASESDTIRQDEARLFDESNKNTFRVLFSGNPGRAALYSLILPGAGQIYNRRYWKLPIVYGGLGAVGYLFYENNKYYQEKKDEYIASFGTGSEQSTFVIYQAAKQTREQSLFAVIGVYLFNVFDAYIDRHLIDFDMSEDLSIRVTPYTDRISPIGVSLALSW